MKRYYLTVFVLAAGVAAFFQNCAKYGSSSPYATMNLPQNHPAITVTPEEQSVAAQAQSRILMGDLRYIQSAFNEAFLNDDSSAGEQGFLQAVMAQELTNEIQLFGRPCDPMENGYVDTCNNNLSNAQLGMVAQTSSGREAGRIQTCRRVLANDTMNARVIEKVATPGDPTPNPTAIAGIVRLFYPNMDDATVAAAVTPLEALDMAMAEGNESIRDRWRMLTLTVCESSGWEAL